MTPAWRLGLPLLATMILVSGASTAAPISVVATTSILADFVRQVGRAEVAVVSLVPPDGDAHVYEPTPGDLSRLGEAKLIVENGMGLEPWLPRLLAAAGPGARIAIASAGVAPLFLGAAAVRVPDPHAWQAVGNARIYVANIARALEALDPTHSQAYRQRATAYDAALAALDADIRAIVAAIPPEKRQVVTTHDAFAYYGRAYGVTFLSPLGVSTEAAEPSAATLAALETAMQRNHIRAVFLETMTDGRLVRQLAQDTGAQIGPPLYADALSGAGGPAATYVAMMRYDTAALAAGMARN